MTSIRFCFDFVSPYSWLALRQAESFAARHAVEWELAPVVYGVLLDRNGLVGPAETESKRDYTFHDVARCAASLGLDFVGPPAHPFLSLGALRTVCLFENEPHVLRLAIALADAAWARGADITRVEVLEDVAEACGLDPAGIRDGIASPKVKDRLREHTDRALAAGVFGVPSFLLGTEIFWGHDRLPLLAQRLEAGLPDTGPAARAMLARPRGVDRKRRS